MEFDTWRILVAGRTVHGKGQEDIVRALGYLKNRQGVSKFHLTILGKVAGEYTEKLMNLIQSEGIEEQVDIVPFVDDPAIYFMNAHIGVTTSRNEAFGRITVEYLKSKMVVIGANAGATTEIIDGRQLGYLYEVDNAIDLANQLMEIFKDKQQAYLHAVNGQQQIEKKFNLSKHGEDLLSILQSLH